MQAVESNGLAGVVRHTQGSGKSMEMELSTNLVLRHLKLLNPTIVGITDRKELDRLRRSPGTAAPQRKVGPEYALWS